MIILGKVMSYFIPPQAVIVNFLILFYFHAWINENGMVIKQSTFFPFFSPKESFFPSNASRSIVDLFSLTVLDGNCEVLSYQEHDY